MVITIVISIISLLISGLSSTVALLSFASNKSKLIFFGDDDPVPEAIIESEITADRINEKGKTEQLPFPNGILYCIQVFNPSPQDISFFNMQYIVDGEIPKNVWSEKTIEWFSDNAKVIMHDPIHGSGEIYIPDTSFGVFKAHSFTPLYLFVSTDGSPYPKQLRFQFNYAVRSFPYFGKNHHYKSFVKDLDITNTEKEMQLKTEAMKQLTQPMRRSQKPNQTPPYSKKRRRRNKK